MKNVSALRDKNWIPSFSSLPLAGENTEGEAGCEDFFSSLLGKSLATQEGHIPDQRKKSNDETRVRSSYDGYVDRIRIE